jgi:restriction endonuclease S subunit
MDLVLANPGGASLEPIVEAQRLMRKSAQMVADVKAQMVADVKAQMVAVFNTSLKSKDTSWLDISSFCKFERSKIQASKNTPGDYPFISLSVSTHNVNLLDNSEHVFISAIPAGNRKMKVQYQSGECSYSSLMFHCVLDKEKVVPKYFYYYLYYNMDILNEYVIGVQPKFSYESFLSRKITMPTLEVQEDIIRRIGIIESQLTSLENLGKQAEDNARFILDSYLNTA